MVSHHKTAFLIFQENERCDSDLQKVWIIRMTDVSFTGNPQYITSGGDIENNLATED